MVLHMKLVKLGGIILYIFLFLFVNNLDQRFFQDNNFEPDYDFANLVFGIDSAEAKSMIGTKYISVNNDGDLQYFLTKATTPVDALIENGYSVSNMNKVITTSPIDSLSNHAYIVLQTYRVITESITVSLPYERLVQGEVLCQTLSRQIVQQKGVLGVMTQTIRKTYQGGDLVASEIIDQKVLKAPINEILILEGPDDSPNMVPKIGEGISSCDYWNLYIDENVSATTEEKKWLKFTMKWESGCQADSNEGYYKGLFQWDPCIWYEQYSKDNIFDGRSQIKNTLSKIRAGGNPKYLWPAVYKKYVATYGELSWLK